ncbi:hypothetical protein AALO_G00035430 [Alosa alosa]|uniref:Uncharacterized protein n=1 Tax=Alosa alosa TaxID=278164 RepID=A0AAV6H691_9TELE|nr:hypothetical protein AALO_G00035430 [Alosa alosa]
MIKGTTPGGLVVAKFCISIGSAAIACPLRQRSAFPRFPLESVSLGDLRSCSSPRFHLCSASTRLLLASFAVVYPVFFLPPRSGPHSRHLPPRSAGYSAPVHVNIRLWAAGYCHFPSTGPTTSSASASSGSAPAAVLLLLNFFHL